MIVVAFSGGSCGHLPTLEDLLFVLFVTCEWDHSPTLDFPAGWDDLDLPNFISQWKAEKNQQVPRVY